ncbi:hypothetical protein BJV82DRAFT_662953 [Fennellomyces sp. T-0311]|nr:hypothetical protein BJV82DRAFT_662953 [Fennellomyces sp. T-0311]
MTIASIYKTCKSVLDGLASVVPGFDLSHRFDHQNTAHIPTPLYNLWQLCRQGHMLCTLFNLLKPDAAIDLTLEQDGCKKQHKVFVYRFIIACRQHLALNEDDLFTVSEMYQDNTIGFCKVISTLHKILVLLHEHGVLKTEYPPAQEPMTAFSLRDKVVLELLETERKYVEYLETTQNYAQGLRSQRNIVSLDTLHHIFGNLNALIDFQLRFLMQVEYYAEHPRGNFGRVLMELEDAFSVYEPYCANMQHALDLVIQWTPQLSSTSVEPTYELPSLLIKPVQRVCKYPLLLQQLMNYTANDWPYYDDLQRGMEAMERVAYKVNETRRLQENKQRVKELKEQVVDWKMITNVDEQCGMLLLHDKVSIHRHNVTKDVTAHLFEKVIILCAEVASKKTKKKKETALWILGLIKLENMVQVDQGAIPMSLQIFWLKDNDLDSFTLEYRNDEQLAQWDSALKKLMHQVTRRKHLSSLVTYGLEKYRDEEDAIAALSPTYLSYASMNKLPVRGGYYDQIPELFDENQMPTRTSSYSHYLYNNNSNNTNRHLQPGPPPSPHSPSCSMPFSSGSSTCGPPSPPQSGSTPPSPSVQVVYQEDERESRITTGNRGRSQSSPNIATSRVTTTTTLPPRSVSQIIRRTTTVKVKLYYNRDNAFVFYAPRDINYSDLRTLAERKTRMKGLCGDFIKYRDEDGDLITIHCDDDIAMAFDSAPRADDAIHLFISSS